MAQYTIRNVPALLDHELRERAKRERKSLNEAALEAIRRGLGLSETTVSYDDMDDLVGTWVHDEVFDREMKYQDSVDEELWR